MTAILCTLVGCSNISPTDNNNSLENTLDENSSLSRYAADSQIDYVQKLSEYNKTNDLLSVQLLGNKNMWIDQPLSHNKIVRHYFEKNQNDDFILYSSSVIGEYLNNSFVAEQYVMAGSNKEFAFYAKPLESVENYYWFPEHENVGTTFSTAQTIQFDGINQNIDEIGKITSVKSVTIYQKLNLIHPEEKINLADLTIETKISTKGVTVNARIIWKIDTSIEKGYVAMLPTITPLMKNLKTSLGNSYELKLIDSKTDILESNEAFSYFFYSDQIKDEPFIIGLAEKIHKFDKTLRLDQPGRKEPYTVWIEHRNKGSVQKIYPQVFEKHIAREGDVFDFSFTIFTGLLSSEN